MLLFFFFTFANELKTYSMECNFKDIKSLKMRFIKSKIVLELPNSRKLQNNDFLLLDGGKTIHSSNKKYAYADEIEVIDTDGNLVGRYFRSDVGINDPNTAIVWYKLD